MHILSFIFMASLKEYVSSAIDHADITWVYLASTVVFNLFFFLFFFLLLFPSSQFVDY